MTSKYDYSDCVGYPTQMLDVCGARFCSNMLHHMCQTECKFKDGIVLTLMKWCVLCYSKTKNDTKGDEGKIKAGELDNFQSANSQFPRNPSPVIPVPTLSPIDDLLTLSPTTTTTANSQPPRNPSSVIPVPTLPPIDDFLTLSPTATTTAQNTTNNVPPKDMNEKDERGLTNGNEGGPNNESEPPDTINIVPTSVPITLQPLRGEQLLKL